MSVLSHVSRAPARKPVGWTLAALTLMVPVLATTVANPGPLLVAVLWATAALVVCAAGRRDPSHGFLWLLLVGGAAIAAVPVSLGPHAPPLLAAVFAAAGSGMVGLAMWRRRQQRVSGGGRLFILDTTAAVLSLAAAAGYLLVVVGDHELDGMFTLLVLIACVDLALATIPAISASQSGTPFTRRDWALSAAFLVAFAGDALHAAEHARIIEGTAPFVWCALEAELLLFLAAASARPSAAGRLRLGGWWEWAPSGLWILAGGSVLLLSHNEPTPATVLILASAALAVAMIRNLLTAREIGSIVIERKRSLIDDLTGLPNRHQFFRSLDLLTRKGADTGQPATLLMIGIDGFRELNDTLGHSSGDVLLHEVGKRLSESLGDEATLMRLSGDEFATLLSNPERTDEVAQALRSCLNKPFELESVTVAVRVTIGVAHFPDDAETAGELARRADVAMTDAKRRRVGIARYNADRDATSVDHLELAADLRQALDDPAGDSLWIGFQPQIDVASGRCGGVEALIRWTHPERGPISPAEMLPVAGRTGQMTTLTDWVLEHSIAAAARLRDGDGVTLRFAVNVSAVTLVDVLLPDRIEEMLLRYGVDPKNLTIEVTEDAVMSDQRRCLDVLERIASLGVEIAIDDFGTGQSSLSQLRYLPASELKIDRSFVQGMIADRLDAEVVRLIVAMGRQIGMRVVAEGVETEIERRALSDLGCHVLQGFGIGRPMPFDDLRLFLAQRGELTLPAITATGTRAEADTGTGSAAA